jgi:hypothetical protein
LWKHIYSLDLIVCIVISSCPCVVVKSSWYIFVKTWCAKLWSRIEYLSEGTFLVVDSMMQTFFFLVYFRIWSSIFSSFSASIINVAFYNSETIGTKNIKLKIYNLKYLITELCLSDFFLLLHLYLFTNSLNRFLRQVITDWSGNITLKDKSYCIWNPIISSKIDIYFL